MRAAAAGLPTIGLLLAMAATVETSTPFGAALLERFRPDLQKQSVDPIMKRAGGTQPADWVYSLPAGVTTRAVTFFVDGGTRLHGKVFLPKGFSPKGKHAAVVVGHGINAVSIGIEKYAARFAEHGLVAMAIDYRSYGWSGSDLRLLEDDPTTDATVSTTKVLRVQAKRTNLNNFREVDDYRAAISFLQGEPGIDAERIGIWGSSNGGAVVVMVAAHDARVKAVVGQVSAVAGIGTKGPVPMRPEFVEDAVARARTGQGAEADGGFSFRTKIDLWGTIINREFRPGSMLDRVPTTTKILWLPVEHDELIPTDGPTSSLLGQKAFKGTSQAIVLPHLTHFQAYSFHAFELGSTLAAEWFKTHLVQATPPPAPSTPAPRDTVAEGGRSAAATRAPATSGAPQTRDVTFYSEHVRCGGTLYLPAGFQASGSHPAVVLAPGWSKTAATLDETANALASSGIVALAIDYRGWGRSGGFLYEVDPIRTDDRLRFSQHTAALRIQRKRLIPDHQVMDIRNAVSWLQGEPGVDRARIGVWGRDVSAGHAVMVAAVDPRIKVIVGEAAIVPGRDVVPQAWAPSAAMLRDDVARARGTFVGSPEAQNAAETRAALAQYRPFHFLSHVPATTAVLWVTGSDASTAHAASKELTGPTDLVKDVATALGWLKARL